MTDRLDEEKIETLRRWGEGLSDDGRDEVRAAGKAILLLIDEIELLHIDLWHEREGVASGSAESAEEPAPDEESAGAGFLPALRARLRAARPPSPR